MTSERGTDGSNQGSPEFPGNAAAESYIAVNDGRTCLGWISGAAPAVKAFHATSKLLGVFPTRVEAVAAIHAAWGR
jgi:hypothetical protein